MNNISLKSKTKMQLFVAILCYGLVFSILILLFIQNFIFSESISMLQFREIDDLAFQQVLRDAHLNLERGNFLELLKLTHYAYGWIYWAPLAFVTYPAFLLSQYLSIDWPLIIIPRDLSLIFSVLIMVYVRKILKIYKAPEWLCAIGVLIYALFPTTAYFSLRFGTVSEVAFLSIFTIYHCLKNEKMSERGVSFAVFSLALTGAVKLSGLLIAPLVVYFVLVRSELSAKNIVKQSVLFIVILTIFTYPLLLLSPFNWEIAKEYFGMLKHFIEVTRLSTGHASALDKIYNGIFGNSYYAFSFMSLFIGIILAGWQSKSNKYDFFAIGCMLLIAIAYLVLSVGDIYSISRYFTSVSYLLVLGVLGLFYTTAFRFLLGLLPLIMLFCFGQSASFALSGKGQGFNSFAYYVKRKYVTEAVALSHSIEDCIESNGGYKPSGHFFKDHTVQLLTNTINNPDVCISNAWNDLNPEKIYCNKTVDYIILDLINPVSLVSQSIFDQRVNKADPVTALNLRTDRSNRTMLMEMGKFGADSFSPVCKLNGVQVYKNNKEKSSGE